MRILVFQHVDCEHPGSLRKFLADDGVEWDAIYLHRGDKIPSFDNYDALWVMGGPMDVWDVEEYPWLIDEKAAIREWVSDLRKPYLGLCLGHQLLADALGGTCGPQKIPEIGVLEIELTEAGKQDPLFKGTAHNQKCLQWHSVKVAQAPEGAVILAKSDVCSVQAMRIGENAWSMQYHVEIEPDTVDNWGAIPEYAEALTNTLGNDALLGLKKNTDKNMNQCLSCAKQIYENFMHSFV